jgi:hypothetical protein
MHGTLLSVALAFGLPRPGVTRRLALRSSDFPPVAEATGDLLVLSNPTAIASGAAPVSSALLQDEEAAATEARLEQAAPQVGDVLLRDHLVAGVAGAVADGRYRPAPLVPEVLVAGP